LQRLLQEDQADEAAIRIESFSRHPQRVAIAAPISGLGIMLNTTLLLLLTQQTLDLYRFSREPIYCGKAFIATLLWRCSVIAFWCGRNGIIGIPLHGQEGYPRSAFSPSAGQEASVIGFCSSLSCRCSMGYGYSGANLKEGGAISASQAEVTK
jgi:hypothetical protein